MQLEIATSLEFSIATCLWLVGISMCSVLAAVQDPQKSEFSLQLWRHFVFLFRGFYPSFLYQIYVLLSIYFPFQPCRKHEGFIANWNRGKFVHSEICFLPLSLNSWEILSNLPLALMSLAPCLPNKRKTLDHCLLFQRSALFSKWSILFVSKVFFYYDHFF